MKKFILFSYIAVSCLLYQLAPAQAFQLMDLFLNETADWPFMESVGGMTVGEPEKIKENVWRIPVQCDVSGLTKITVEPVALNSAVAVKKIRYRLEDKKLYLRVTIGVAGKGETRMCKPIIVEAQSGIYDVYYDDKNALTKIGKIELK